MESTLAKQNLRKRSFRGSDLHGADLHGADLRGADFSGANLAGANLRGVRTGLERGPMLGWAVTSIVISIAAGVCSGWAGDAISRMLYAGGRFRAAAIVVLVELALFLIVALWRGLRPALVIVAPAVIVAASGIAIWARVSGFGTGFAAVAGLVLVVAYAAIIVVGTLARGVGGSMAPIVLALAAVSGAMVARRTGGGISALAVAFVSVLISRRALRGDRRYPLLRRMLLWVACAGGTRFRGADLRGAHLDGAHLRGSDFRGADLRGATFSDAHDRMLCRT